MIKSDKPYRFAIVGTGPAGFYMAKNLQKNVANCTIDLIDRNPHPFGLIRTGVAPDHQAMKKIENDFSDLLASENVNFFGNVWLGRLNSSSGCSPVSIDELRRNYSAVILAYGATSDRELGLENEKLTLPSRKVVDWYNGSLDCENLDFDLKTIERLAIIGNGNIACDISRMLLKDVNEFKDSDAPSHVLEALRKSKLHTIEMIARRGVTQAAFSTKEIKEVCSLSNVPKFYIVKKEWDDSMSPEASKTELLIRGVGRRTEFLGQNATMIESREQYLDIVNNP